MSPVPVVLCFGALDAMLFAQAAYFVKEYTAKDASPSAGEDGTSGDDVTSSRPVSRG